MNNTVEINYYPQEPGIINYNHPSIVKVTDRLKVPYKTDFLRTKAAFEWVRDEIGCQVQKCSLPNKL